MKKERTSIIINDKTMHLLVGVDPNTLPKNDDLWDISLEDILTGAVEVNEDLLYVYHEGRCYETDMEL